VRGFTIADTPPRVMRVGLIALAAVAALAPIPPALVERWYSRGVYLSVQRVLTGASNLTSLAWLDVLIGLAVVVALAWIVVRLLGGRSRGWGRAVVRMVGEALLAASCVYLVFLAAWGLNYRRVPLRQTLDFDETRVTSGALVTLADSAVREVNGLYAPAHAREWPAIDAMTPVLSAAFDQTQRDLGLPRPALTGRPKRSILSWYFSRAAIDGMTDPFALEVLINPEVLPVERPMGMRLFVGLGIFLGGLAGLFGGIFFFAWPGLMLAFGARPAWRDVRRTRRHLRPDSPAPTERPGHWRLARRWRHCQPES